MAVSGVNGIGVITYETKSKRTVNSAEKFIVEETDSTQEMSEAEAMVAFKKEFYDDLSKITDEKTGEETEVEDYDWEAITKAVKSFIEDYNDVVKEAGESNTKDVLRNAAWMTGMTDKSSNILDQIGITIGKGNKLELDEDALKKSDISSLKSVFTGYNSYASKISQKATSIGNAANRATATYTNNGTYSKVDSSLTSSKIDKEV